MEIDTTTVIISAVASLFFIVPIVLDQLNKDTEEEENQK